jgi:hypothetical protein
MFGNMSRFSITKTRSTTSTVPNAQLDPRVRKESPGLRESKGHRETKETPDRLGHRESRGYKA